MVAPNPIFLQILGEKKNTNKTKKHTYLTRAQVQNNKMTHGCYYICIFLHILQWKKNKKTKEKKQHLSDHSSSSTVNTWSLLFSFEDRNNINLTLPGQF